MDVGSAGNFFVGSILYGMGVIVLVAVFVIINNIFANYWKPIEVLKFTEYPPKENA